DAAARPDRARAKREVIDRDAAGGVGGDRGLARVGADEHARVRRQRDAGAARRVVRIEIALAVVELEVEVADRRRVAGDEYRVAQCIDGDQRRVAIDLRRAYDHLRRGAQIGDI